MEENRKNKLEQQKKKEEAKIKAELAKQQHSSMKKQPKTIWASGNNNMSFVADNNPKNNSGQSTQQTNTGGSYPPPVLPAIPPVSHAERSRADMKSGTQHSGLYVKDMEPYDRYSAPYHDTRYDDRYEKSVANGQKLTMLRNALGLPDFNNTLSSYHTNNTNSRSKPLMENVEQLVQSSSDSTQSKKSKSTNHTNIENEFAMVEPSYMREGPSPIMLAMDNGNEPQSTVRSVEIPPTLDSERTPGIMLSDVRLNNAPYSTSELNQTYNTVSVHSSQEKETTPSKKIDIRTVGGVPSIGPAFDRLISEVRDKQSMNRNISERILSNEFEPIGSNGPQISLKSAMESSGRQMSGRQGSEQHSHHPSDDTVKIHTSRSGTTSRNNNTDHRQNMWSEPELKDVPVTDV